MKRLLSAAVLVGAVFAVLICRHAAASPGVPQELEALKSEPYSYVKQLKAMVSAAIDQGELNSALDLLQAFDAYPMAPEALNLRLRLAYKLREASRFDEAERVVREGITADPLGRDAPQAMELHAYLLGHDLGRAKEAEDIVLSLAAYYYPGVSSVQRARATLGPSAPVVPPSKMVLLDSSLHESSVYDRGPTGSNNFGQYEVMRTIAEAGYIVHSNADIPREQFTPEIMKRYGLIVLNGRYNVSDSQPIPQSTIDSLVSYVSGGGSLLVVAGGSALGDKKQAQTYNPLVNCFGLHFEEGVTLKKFDGRGVPDPLIAGIGEFHAEHGVPVRASGGHVIGCCGDDPVIAATAYGRGKVVIAGLGSGLMGQCMNTHTPPTVPALNKKLLTQLVCYLLPPSR